MRLSRDDTGPDADFYRVPRFVTHLDDAAIAAVSDLYDELGVDGDVLDLMSSWVSHLRRRPARLTVLGLNAEELAANPMADERVVHDLNADPALPFADASYDAVLCCVSIDYLVDPVAVLAEVARVLRPGAPVVVTFSNRCFPTKAVHAWLATDDAGRCAMVADHLAAAGGFAPARVERRTPAGRYRGDPVYAVTATRAPGPTRP
ncbi:class I SAM-dependent methyltransferase [Nocardioides lentus]|uniref:Class I SAM-dependent methyltransferase n=1 Tax=Nocardioides lentus TaxID=338077 RepID=A0ABN2NUJ4_9ACTN